MGESTGDLARGNAATACQHRHHIIAIRTVAVMVEGGMRPLTNQSHIASLQKKHDQLEDQLRTVLNQPSSDDRTIADLKRRKLRIKDELTRLTA